MDGGGGAGRRGEVGVPRDRGGPPLQLGQQFTVTGGARLTVVGIAKSITDTADGWVVPTEIAALRTPGTPAVSQMLYRFASARSDAAVNADPAAVKGALPSGAPLGPPSHL